MNLEEIYKRIEELLDLIEKNSENKDLVKNFELEISSLDRLREEMEEGL